MPFATVGQENSQAIRVYFEDHGSGRPVLLIAGFLLTGQSWEKQELALLEAGYRVVTYDRRGFGSSTHPSVGYDYDTFAADLDNLINRLDINDVTLVGSCMGTGEIVRYLATYGSRRVTAAVLLAPLPPFLLRTDDNPYGIDRAVLDDMTRAIRDDRPAVIKAFLDNSYNIDVLGGSSVSDQAWQQSFIVASGASARATLGCVTAWLEDFRTDVLTLDVPVLVVQGGEDRIFPPEATGNRLSGTINNVQHVVIRGAPHAIIWTHADPVNELLLDFLEDPYRLRGDGHVFRI